MRYAVRYQSRGGNTKAVAEAIAEALNAKAEPVGSPLGEPVDVLFVGGGVYAWTIDRALVEFLTSLEPDIVKSVAVFSTGGMMSGVGKIASIAKARGIAVNKTTMPVRMGFRNYAGSKGSVTLSEKQLRMVDAFVSNITENGSV